MAAEDVIKHEEKNGLRERTQRSAMALRRHPKVLAITGVLLISLAVSVFQTGGRSSSAEHEPVELVLPNLSAMAPGVAPHGTDAKSQGYADSVMSAVNQAYDQASDSVDSARRSWKAKYERGYSVAKDELEKASGQRKRDDSIQEKLKEALSQMEERLREAQAGYVKEYDSIVDESVASLQERMNAAAEEARKKYKDGKISLKEAREAVQRKAQEAKEGMYVNMDDEATTSKLEQAYNNMHKAVRDARVEYVKAYDSIYDSSVNAKNKVVDGAQGTADSASSGAKGAYDTIRDAPKDAADATRRVYHDAAAAVHGSMDGAAHMAKAAQHKVKSAMNSASTDARKGVRDAKDTARSSADSAAHAARTADTEAQACTRSAQSSFDVAYEQAKAWLVDAAAATAAAMA